MSAYENKKIELVNLQMRSDKQNFDHYKKYFVFVVNFAVVLLLYLNLQLDTYFLGLLLTSQSGRCLREGHNHRC